MNKIILASALSQCEYYRSLSARYRRIAQERIKQERYLDELRSLLDRDREEILEIVSRSMISLEGLYWIVTTGNLDYGYGFGNRGR